MMNEFGKHLKAIRLSVNLAQKEISEKLGVVESCYANWEQGRTEPNINNIRKLAKIFEVSYDELLDY
jgi:transcriptional regulator with XRE-family HTH domain